MTVPVHASFTVKIAESKFCPVTHWGPVVHMQCNAIPAVMQGAIIIIPPIGWLLYDLNLVIIIPVSMNIKE